MIDPDPSQLGTVRAIIGDQPPDCEARAICCRASGASRGVL